MGPDKWYPFKRVIHTHTHTHTHTRLMALFPGLPRWASTRKVKPIWILLKQVTVSGSGISSAICKSAPCSRQTTTPALHHSVFYRPDALPAAQPTASKHWRQKAGYAVKRYSPREVWLYFGAGISWGVNRHSIRYISPPPCLWSHSVSWYLADGYRNKHRPVGLGGSGRALLFYLYGLWMCIGFMWFTAAWRRRRPQHSTIFS